MSSSADRGRGFVVLVAALGLGAVIACGALGFLLGTAQAPDDEEAATERANSFRASYSSAYPEARADAMTEGRRDGIVMGTAKGEKSGAKAGESAGSDAAQSELDRIEEERVAAEAAAALAAELAIPEPCRGMPDSTARRMCIGAVEAGTYP